MKSTSCEGVARQVLADCIAGRPPKNLPATLLQDQCARALFGVLVEGLADRFDPSIASGLAVFAGFWLVAKDWRDLVPSQRDTTEWRLGLHGRSAPLRATRRADPPLLPRRPARAARLC